MQDLSYKTIKKLLGADGAEPKVTIYAPMQTTASSPHITENQIRFKNVIRQAVDQLKQQGYKEAASLLDDQLDLYMDDMSFWESQTEGLLICADTHAVQYFHLPIDTEEYIAIDTCYHLAPVLALLGDEQPFYVLVVAQHQPKLFSGSLYGLCELEVGMPENLRDSLRLDEFGQHREQSRAMGGNVEFNGRGGNRDPRDEERLRFFRLIDEIVNDTIERDVPLILAGTDSELAEYRGISKHPAIMKRAMTGSFSGAKAHDLYRPSYEIMYEDLIIPRREAALQRYDDLKGTQRERVAEDPLAIAEAAKQGRIDTLLITLKRSTADTVRDTAKVVERLTFPRAEISAITNKTANAVAKARGRIINVDIDSIAAATPVLALLRY